MSESEHADELSELPPSRVLVYKALQRHGPLTRRQVVDETYLCDSTAGDALADLVDEGIVDYDHRATDARKREYRIR